MTVTIGLLTAVVVGLVGTTANAELLLASDTAATVYVENTTVHLAPGQSKTVSVPLTLTLGEQREVIRVAADGITQTVAVRTIGTPRARIKWWLGIPALALFIGSVRVQRVSHEPTEESPKDLV